MGAARPRPRLGRRHAPRQQRWRERRRHAAARPVAGRRRVAVAQVRRPRATARAAAGAGLVAGGVGGVGWTLSMPPAPCFEGGPRSSGGAEQRAAAPAECRSSLNPPASPLGPQAADDEAAVVARLTRSAAALAAAHACMRLRAHLEVADEAAATAAGGAVVSASDWREGAPALRLRLSYGAAPPVLRALTFSRTSGSGAASESLVSGLLRVLDTSAVTRLKLCEGLSWAPAAWWGAEPARWRALQALSLSGCGLSSLSPAIGALPQLTVCRGRRRGGTQGCGASGEQRLAAAAAAAAAADACTGGATLERATPCCS
jgi:hypothetical protein